MPVEQKHFDQADEIRELPKAKVEVLNLNGSVMMRATFEPDWKWSECLKPEVGTDSCEVSHLCYIISGRMTVLMDDGTQADLGPGDAAQITPGHDAWVVGNEPCVMIDFGGDANYGKA